jgi:ribosome recycling factor
MNQDVIDKVKASMEKSIDSLRKDFTRVRTGRASITLLDEIRVDYYGTPTPLSGVASMTVPEPRMIVIQPWEKKLLPDIEKAILKSDLGLNPNSDGSAIRLIFPAWTEDRRKEMVKTVKKLGDETKVAIRNLRRDANDTLKKMEKDKLITEDQLKRAEKDVQDATDAFVKKVDEVVVVKDKEIMEI